MQRTAGARRLCRAGCSRSTRINPPSRPLSRLRAAKSVRPSARRAGRADDSSRAPAPDLGRRLIHSFLAAGDCLHGIEGAIGSICEQQRWSGGVCWWLDEASGNLIELTRWPTGGPAATSPAPAGARAPPWLGDEPVWISELSADALQAQDPKAWQPRGRGVILPLHSGTRLLGLIAFEGPRAAQRSVADAIDTLRAAGPIVSLYLHQAIAAEQLRDSAQRLASTLTLAAVGIAHVDDSGRFLYVNPRLCQMLGYSEPELLELNVKQISHPDDVNATDGMRDQLRRGEIDSFKMEKRYLHRDGGSIWVALTVAVRRDAAGRRLYDVSIVEDISSRKLAEQQVQYLATHDGLTGLPNRAMFVQLLALASESAKRRGSKIAVLFIDLDRFKTINDSLGHDAGDALLREMAVRFRECLRSSDIVARLGGDEFVVVLQDVCDQSQVSTVARHILSVAMRPVQINRQECRVTASVGICLHPQSDQDDHAVLKNADLAMYVAKEEGKNRYQFYSSSLCARSAGRLAIETCLREALERDELALHYQAKVSIETDAITGVEALLRWNSPALGPVSPVQFIPVAEETGLIVPIGRWVLRSACAQSAQWVREGLPAVRICVNLSMRQLQDAGLVADIAAALAEYGVRPELLELELTESSIMHNAERAVRVLSEIKALGVRLAIDDFGTGYSSLAQLKRLPIDTLKVDRSFIRDIPHEAEDRAITEAIIAMGKTLSLTIVAEGVETPQQKAFLREHACDEMQGYYFSTPIPAGEFAELLRRSTQR